MTRSGGACLEVRNVSVRYGGVVANDDVTLRAEVGRVTALIGPNGAGKTTLINAVSGLIPFTGDVVLDGSLLNGSAPHQRSRRGLARTWQAGEMFESLSVLDNVRVAEETAGLRALLGDLGRSSRSAERRARELLASVGLTDHADAFPQNLSLGQRRLAGVARALAANPRAILLDEPAAGLGSLESATLGERLRSMADLGLAVLLVDHDMSLVFGTADYVYVLDFGRIIAEGEPQAVQSHPAVVKAYLGATLTGSDA
jgi:branched-chain amino acid transport system ATP-binding protein